MAKKSKSSKVLAIATISGVSVRHTLETNAKGKQGYYLEVYKRENKTEEVETNENRVVEITYELTRPKRQDNETDTEYKARCNAYEKLTDEKKAEYKHDIETYLKKVSEKQNVPVIKEVAKIVEKQIEKIQVYCKLSNKQIREVATNLNK